MNICREGSEKIRMEDLFKREQQIYDEAVSYMERMQEGATADNEKYALLVKEYGRLLKQLRSFTKISDRTTVDLNASKLDLLDKVNYDALTGIFNRRFLDEKLQELTAQICSGEHVWLSVMMIDIDFFKRFNDTYGHQAGDECLRQVAGVLKNAAAGPDEFVARYGGEEFIAVLPGMDAEQASELAERLLENVRECKIPHEKNDAAGCVTVSVGVTAGRVCADQSAQEYVGRADQALYLSKQNGRNRSTLLEFEEPDGR